MHIIFYSYNSALHFARKRRFSPFFKIVFSFCRPSTVYTTEVYKDNYSTTEVLKITFFVQKEIIVNCNKKLPLFCQKTVINNNNNNNHIMHFFV